MSDKGIVMNQCRDLKETYEKVLAARGKIFDAIKNWPQVKKTVSAKKLIDDAQSALDILEVYSEVGFNKRILPLIDFDFYEGDFWEVDQEIIDEKNQHAKNLARILRHSANVIKHLAIAEREVPLAALKEIFNALKAPFCQVFDLYFESAWLQPDAADVIVEELIRPDSKLRQLALTDNNLGDEGAQKIAKALADPNCRLEKIVLQDNYITDVGAQSLLDALNNPACKLQDLFISMNPISKEMHQLLQKDKRIHIQSTTNP